MKKIIIFLVFFFLIWHLLEVLTKEMVREPAVAGLWYPGKKKELENLIKEYLKNVPEQKIEGKIVGLIVPHAGYEYSGQVAAYAYKLIKNYSFNTIILIGISHFTPLDGISVYEEGYFKTPLGNVPIDKDLAKSLIKENPRIYFDISAHQREHSLEAQIPFLQVLYPKFKIVPIVMGNPSLENRKILSEALVKNLKNKNALIIISSDMSHYHSYPEAVKMDKEALKLISKLNIKELINKISSGEVELCGAGPVLTMMLSAKKLGVNKIKVLKYANSGDVTGDKSKVVGYTAVVFIANKKRKEKSKMEDKPLLSESAKKKLLLIVRKTIEEYVKTGKILQFKEELSELNQPCGAFVTLKKNGELRGCIGNLQAKEPLYLTVRNMAISSATQDPRFPPVKPAELKDIHIEISVLSPLKKIKNPEEIVVGKHGVLIQKGFRSGVFLPQVAPEQGWNREEMLNNLCAHKAGLSPDAWKQGADIYIFTAEVFEEE